MKRLFTHLRLLPDALPKTSAGGRAGAAAVECPNCGTVARSVDCKANVASRAGGSSGGGSSSGGAVPGSTLSAARPRVQQQQQQQQCGVTSHAAAQPQPQRYERVANATGTAVRNAQSQGTASGRSMADLLIAGGLGTAGGIAIASM